MSINLHGKIPSPIYISGRIGKVLPTFTVTFKDGDTVLQQVQVRQGGTAVYDGTVSPKDGNAFLGWVLSEPSNPIVDSDNVTAYQQIPNIQADTICWAVYSDKSIIHDSWEVISQRSQAGTASEYYNVGDIKKIRIQGYVGTTNLDKYVWVTVLGIDHNREFENAGITFGCFKDTSKKDICFIDGKYSNGNYESRLDDGTKTFNMNHWGNANYGGWAGSDMRYDILGSTDVAPSGYGSIVDSSRVGYDATSTCATNPVANTLMSCLPSDLRAVMKPIIKYTDNTGGGAWQTPVTATTDYLPLISEFETFGSASYSSSSKQAQYSYFSNTSNNKAKYKHNSSSSLANWWLRSTDRTSGRDFCYVYSSGSPTSGNIYASLSRDSASYSIGISPVFLV